MKKLLISVVSIPLTSFLLTGQNRVSSQTDWSGLLVAAACHPQMSTAGPDRSLTAQPGMPRKTASSAPERNTTYEQAQNQADRTRNTAVGDQMARTTDRGTPVAQTADDSLARTTTPPIDDEGTRGKATINNTAAKDAANRADYTHDADRAAPGKLIGSDADATKGMHESCRIGQTTTAFALRLADGSMVKFDDASNGKIAQQIQSGNRVQLHKTKIFRAKVKGSMQGGVIAANTIQM